MQNTTLYGEDHGAVKELQTKINGLKVQLNSKVAALISNGITVQDPLVARQEIITNLLTLDSEIMGIRTS